MFARVRKSGIDIPWTDAPANVLFDPHPVDGFGSRHTFGKHRQNFTLDRGPDAVEDEPRRFPENYDRVQTDLSVAVNKERDNAFGCVAACYKFDYNSLFIE